MLMNIFLVYFLTLILAVTTLYQAAVGATSTVRKNNSEIEWVLYEKHRFLQNAATTIKPTSVQAVVVELTSSDSGEQTFPEVQLFHLSAQIDTRDVCFTFLILLSCTILIEGFVEWLNKVLKEYEHWLAIVNQVNKELMILGIISFMLTCFKQIPGWTTGISETWDASIEFAHNLLFFIGLSFAVVSLAVCLVVVNASGTWQKIEDTSQTAIEAFVSRYTNGNAVTKFFLNLMPMSNTVDYLLLKHSFVTTRKLPMNFDFKTYVQLVMLSNVNNLLDVELSSWVVLSVITLAGVSGTYLSNGASHALEIGEPPIKDWAPLKWQRVFYYIIVGIGMLCIEFLVFLVVRRAVSRVVEQECFDGYTTFKRIMRKIDASKKMEMHGNDAGTGRTKKKKDKDKKSSKHRGSMESSTKEEKQEGEDNEQFTKLDLSYAFPFNSPYLYGKFIDAFLLLKCLYLALFFVYFAASSCDDGYGKGLLLLVGLLFPNVASSLIFTPMIFKLEAVLNCVAKVKPTILGKVLELMNSKSAEFKEQVSAHIRSIIGELKNEQRLQKLFQDLDTDGSGLLTAKEFELGLARLGIYYTPHQFKTLVLLLNPSGGEIDYRTFIDFVYPEVPDVLEGTERDFTDSIPMHLKKPFQEFLMHLDQFDTRSEDLMGADLRAEKLKLYYKIVGREGEHICGGGSNEPVVKSNSRRKSMSVTQKTKRFSIQQDETKDGYS